MSEQPKPETGRAPLLARIGRYGHQLETAGDERDRGERLDRITEEAPEGDHPQGTAEDVWHSIQNEAEHKGLTDDEQPNVGDIYTKDPAAVESWLNQVTLAANQARLDQQQEEPDPQIRRGNAIREGMLRYSGVTQAQQPVVEVPDTAEVDDVVDERWLETETGDVVEDEAGARWLSTDQGWQSYEDEVA